MTKRATTTQASLIRAIKAAKKAGVEVLRIVLPDGTTIETLNTYPQAGHLPQGQAHGSKKDIELW